MQFDTAPNSNWLPTFPTVAIRILDLFAKEDVAIVELANEIKLDPVLTAKLLNVANSPLYRSKREIATLEHAVSWLGKSEVAGLVLSFKMANFASQAGRDSRYYHDFWRQSFVQGCAMSRIAECTGRIAQGEAYVCGLLMDFGMLLMLDGYPTGYTKIIDESRKHGTPLHEVESERLQITHSEIGSELLENMGLPVRYSQVAGLHTMKISELPDLENHQHFDLLTAAIASSAIGDFYCRNNQAEALGNLEKVCRNHLGMSESDIEWLLDSVRSDLAEKASLYQVSTDDMLPIGQLVGRATGQFGTGIGRVDLGNELGAVLQNENKVLRQLISNMEDRICKDSLTGIYNRDYFTGRLNERINSDAFVNDKFSLVVIDIDNFKQINDGHGHLKGDEAITWMARFLCTYFDKGLVARFGGDEFVILIDADSKEEFEKLLVELCKDVRENSVGVIADTQPLKISAGAIYCQIENHNSSLPIQIFDMADKAMYEAKKAGGDGCKVVSIQELPDSWTGSIDAVSQKHAITPATNLVENLSASANACANDS